MSADLETLIAARVAAELDHFDTEEMYDRMIDEAYDFAQVGGPFERMQPSAVLKEMDATAYRCGHNDYVDSLSRDREYEEIDGELYNAREVEAIRDEIEAEHRANTDDDQHDAEDAR